MIAAGATAAATAATTAWWVAPGIVAAVITAAIALFTLASQARRSRLDRQRQLFADAYAAITQYCEFPYIIRRRSNGAEERVRISTTMSEVQHRLNRQAALIAVESPRTARRFDRLVSETRWIAGTACRDAWTRPVLGPDDTANISDIDLSALEPAKAAYLDSVRDHLTPIRGRMHRLFRWTAPKVRSAGPTISRWFRRRQIASSRRADAARWQE